MTALTQGARRIPLGAVRAVTRHAIHARLLWHAAPAWSIVSLLATVIKAGASIAGIVAIGRVIGHLDAVLKHDGSSGQLWTWFAVLAGALVLEPLCQAATSMSSSRLIAQYRSRVADLLAETALHSTSIQPLDDSDFGQSLRAVKDSSNHWLFRFGLSGTFQLFGTRLTAVGSLALLMTWNWWIPFLVAGAFAFCSITLTKWVDQIYDELWGVRSPELLRADYVVGLLTSAAAAKEVRLFGIAGWLKAQYSALWNAFMVRFWMRASKSKRPMYISVAVLASVLVGSLALLAHDIADKTVSVTLSTSYLIALLGLVAFGPQGDTQSGLARVSAALRRLVELRSGVGLPAFRTTSQSPVRASAQGASAVRFEDVTFGYQADAPIIRNFSLQIPAGQHLAIVGVNGAGKSTIVKLLAGLYEPTAGKVYVDDRCVYTDRSTRGRVAVLFQDFVHYPLTIRENVAFGAIAAAGSESDLHGAMQDAAADVLLSRPGRDWDSILSNEFAGGIELSGGEWQRIALARAFMAVRNGAGVVVLDEPTASLDVRAETAIFDQFRQHTSDVTTILVSHRLSSVRDADRIVVLDGQLGRICEDGTHEELLRNEGPYAAMFHKQAARFRRQSSREAQ